MLKKTILGVATAAAFGAAALMPTAASAHWHHHHHGWRGFYAGPPFIIPPITATGRAATCAGTGPGRPAAGCSCGGQFATERLNNSLTANVLKQGRNDAALLFSLHLAPRKDKKYLAITKKT